MESTTARQPMDDRPSSPGARPSHDEKNLAEFPLVLLSTGAPKLTTGVPKRASPKRGTRRYRDTLEYEDMDQHPVTGAQVLRKVTVMSPSKIGLPTTGDEDVLMALIYLTIQAKSSNEFGGGNSDTDRTVYFARSQLFKLLGWRTDNGEYYARLKQSLRRWKGVVILYENWWDPIAEEYVTDDGFNILDNYQLRDGRRNEHSQLSLPLGDATPQRGLCSITWNKKIFNSFKADYLTAFDLDKFLKLPSAAAKRAYRYLNLHLPDSGSQEFDLQKFAYQHVGYTTYKPARLRSKVQETIVEPLEKHDFIEPMPSTRRFLKQDGRDRILFARKVSPDLPSLPSDHAASPPPESLPASSPAPLAAELKCRGLGGKLAAKFVADHSADYIEQKIDYFDVAHAAAPIKNPGGWLRAAIEQDYGPPAGYVPRTERERQERDTKEREQQRQRDVGKQQANQAREEAERQAIAAYWNSLPPDEQAALDANTIAQADADILQIEHGPLKSLGQRIRREAYIRQMLQDQGKFPIPAE